MHTYFEAQEIEVHSLLFNLSHKGYYIPSTYENKCDEQRLEKSRYQEELKGPSDQEKWEIDRFKSADQFKFGSKPCPKVHQLSTLRS